MRVDGYGAAMTDAPDIEAIRAARSGAERHIREFAVGQRLYAVAPGFLIALCDEIERLRTALFGDVAEYVILSPENFKKLVEERAAWRALADRLIQGFGLDDPEDYHATTAEYRRLKRDS